MTRTETGNCHTNLDPKIFFGMSYDHIRKMARSLMRGERSNHTVGATGLCNEAWLKMVQSPFEYKTSDEFFRLIHRSMQQILTDYARKRSAMRRPDSNMVDVARDGRSFNPVDPKASQVELRLQYHQALEDLAEVDPRGAKMLFYRIDLGLNQRKIAEMVGLCERQTRAELAAAKKWVAARIDRPKNQNMYHPKDEGDHQI